MTIECARCGDWSHDGILCQSCRDKIERADFKSRIHQLEAELARKDKLYSELIMAVGRKYPGETRHQTALRYIRMAEIGDHREADKAGDELK
jgi:hypothetical protein